LTGQLQVAGGAAANAGWRDGSEGSPVEGSMRTGPISGGPVRGGRLGGDPVGDSVRDWSARARGEGAGSDGKPGSDSRSGQGWSSVSRRRQERRKQQTPLGAALSAVSEVVVVVALALTLALVIKTFLVQAFFIPSESMEETLLKGDRVLVSKLTPRLFDLHRGDIVVFKDPGGWLDPTIPVDKGPVRNGIQDVLTFVGLLPQDSGEHLIKRVIGLPGDTVMCCDDKDRIKVNGVPVDEPYTFPGDAPSTKTFSETVPAGHLWVLGDHRSVSYDSRYHLDREHGMVPVEDVVGKAFVIVWPLGRASTLSVPDTVFGRVPNPPTSGS
jgi:signal peptidase I